MRALYYSWNPLNTPKYSYDPCCNHDIRVESKTVNYFERGKHAYDWHYTFINHFPVSQYSKLHASNGYIIKFVSDACNYYERGGDKFSLYVTNNYKLHLPTVNMQWNTSISLWFIHMQMPMHRKKDKLQCCMLYTLCCSILCSTLTITMVDVSTPQDPGIW
jgi:hypothetical protein